MIYNRSVKLLAAPGVADGHRRKSARYFAQRVRGCEGNTSQEQPPPNTQRKIPVGKQQTL